MKNVPKNLKNVLFKVSLGVLLSIPISASSVHNLVNDLKFKKVKHSHKQRENELDLRGNKLTEAQLNRLLSNGLEFKKIKYSYKQKEKELDLRHNKLNESQLDRVLNSIKYPLDIEVLDISHNNLRTLPKSISKFKNLKKLYIRHNNMEYLPEEFWSSEVTIFKGFSKLAVLDLSYNRLEKIKDGSFDDLKNLKRLRISNNNIRALSNNIWDNKVSLFNNLDYLEELDLSYNQIEKIEPLTSSYYGLRNLEILDFSHNKIYKLEKNAFDSLVNLKELCLAHNSISDLIYNHWNKSITAFDSLEKLEKLDLRYNKLKHLPKMTSRFGGLRNLKTLDFAHNEIESISEESFNGLYSLEKLYLDFNRLSSFPIGRYGYKVKVFNSLGNLQILDLAYNNFSWIDNTTFNELKKLKKLYLDHNNLKKISDNFWNNNSTFIDTLRELETLDLSFNDIKSLPQNIFLKLPRLNKLYIDKQQRENMRLE